MLGPAGVGEVAGFAWLSLGALSRMGTRLFLGLMDAAGAVALGCA